MNCVKLMFNDQTKVLSKEYPQQTVLTNELFFLLERGLDNVEEGNVTSVIFRFFPLCAFDVT